MSSPYEAFSRWHPFICRGAVWCHECGRSQKTNPVDNLRFGWPKCCGYTMSIDSPEERRLQARIEELEEEK